MGTILSGTVDTIYYKKSDWITGWLRVIKALHVKTRAINRRCVGRDSDCSVRGASATARPTGLAVAELRGQNNLSHDRDTGV